MKESIVSVGVGVGMGVGVEWALVLASMIITSPDAWEWARFIYFHQPEKALKWALVRTYTVLKKMEEK